MGYGTARGWFGRFAALVVWGVGADWEWCLPAKSGFTVRMVAIPIVIFTKFDKLGEARGLTSMCLFTRPIRGECYVG